MKVLSLSLSLSFFRIDIRAPVENFTRQVFAVWYQSGTFCDTKIPTRVNLGQEIKLEGGCRPHLCVVNKISRYRDIICIFMNLLLRGGSSSRAFLQLTFTSFVNIFLTHAHNVSVHAPVTFPRI